MALSKEPAASESLVRAQHTLGHLLTYFLALGPPGASNLRMWSTRSSGRIGSIMRGGKNESSSSLRKCRSRRTKLCGEFDAVSKAMEVTTDGLACKEMEQRLAAIQTSLNAVKNSITKFKNLIEDCRMVEEELRWIEEDEVH